MLTRIFPVIVAILLSGAASTAVADTIALGVQPAAPLQATRALSAQTLLAARLIRRLDRTGTPGGNILVSPGSLAGALAMLELGADEPMRQALHRTLGFDAKEWRSAASDLEGLRATAAVLAAAKDGPLAFANAIVFDPRSAPHKLAVLGLRSAGAEVTTEDLSKPETLARINEWVSVRTKGLIPSILDQAPRDGGLVALNALHFKDRWRVPFDPADTRPASFEMVGGRKVELPMMSVSETLRFRQNARFAAVDLRYANDRFALVVMTTKDKPARVREFEQVAGWFNGDGFAERAGELTLPRFALAGSAELLPALDALGLRRGRLSPTALERFSQTPQIVSRVIQRTHLSIDEQGTEAAAATAVTTLRSASADVVKMVVDKPFLFALRDRVSGLILLAGYVGEPKASAAPVSAR